jgi:hypothetical protein
MTLTRRHSMPMHLGTSLRISLIAEAATLFANAARRRPLLANDASARVAELD